MLVRGGWWDPQRMSSPWRMLEHRAVGPTDIEGTDSLRSREEKSRRGQKKGRKIGDSGFLETERR